MTAGEVYGLISPDRSVKRPAAVAAGTVAGNAIAIVASAPSITLGSRSPGLHEALERAELPIVNAAWRAFAKPIDNGNGGEVRFGCEPRLDERNATGAGVWIRSPCWRRCVRPKHN